MRTDDLLQCRFAISPLNETADALRSLAQRGTEPYHLPWQRQVRQQIPALRLAPGAGLAATLNDLDPKVSWRGGVLRFSITARKELDVSGTELVLIPSVFIWPRAAVSFDPPAVIYPARGIAEIWRPHPRSSDDLARLVGRTRAALLTALADPASTTGLSARTGVPVSSVSEHLAVLRAAGLISARRAGRFLVHQQTALGAALSASTAAACCGSRSGRLCRTATHRGG